MPPDPPHSVFEGEGRSRRDALSSQVIDAIEAHEMRRPAMKKPSTRTVRGIGKLQDQQLTFGTDLTLPSRDVSLDEPSYWPEEYHFS